MFENRSPAFGPALGDLSVMTGVERSTVASGRCEVVCFSADRTGSFATQTPQRARTIIDAWAHRTEALSALQGVEQVFVFENRGVEIGVTLHHPHGQIYAYPYVTPRTQRLLTQARQHHGDLQGEILQREPPARAWSPRPTTGRPTSRSRHGGRSSLHVQPKRRIPDLAATRDTERDDLAVLSLRLLRALDALYDGPTPYIAAWHQAPVREDRDLVRLTWQITSHAAAPTG